ncbi:hypothetical protein BYT27DRAFT_7343964 [Phlegmacium glaucopus]|nr:hypothetical protein BYT27DRAFT_7343964 [Phlegmacium glaucopus]
MSARPKHDAVANRLPTDTLIDNKTRRSSAQVKKDQQAQIVAKAATVESTKIAKSQQQARVAHLEDKLRKEDQLMEELAIRPDLQVKAHSTQPKLMKNPQPIIPRGKMLTSVEVVDDDDDYYLDSEMISKYDLGNISEEMADIPEESTLDTDSDGAGLRVYDLSDGDHDKDEDYVNNPNQQSELDSESEDNDILTGLTSEAAHQHIKKSVKKTQRGDFRKAINAAREAPPVVGTMISAVATKKRKEPTTVNKPSNDKRAKRVEPSGLLAGWKRTLADERTKAIKARNVMVTAAREDDHDDDRDPLEYAGGEFDDDEPAEAVQAARISKEIAEVRVRSGNSMVKVFEPAPARVERSTSGRGRVKKEKYTVSSLPFPQGSANVAYLQRWRKKDPFGTNTVMDTVVEDLWVQVFPSLATAFKGEASAAIIQVAGDVLINWRSSMGKEGIFIAVKALKESEVSDDDAPAATAYLLENLSFLFENPNAAGDKGGFRGSLVVSAFGAHLKKTIGYVLTNDRPYGYPLGGLAVAAAVVERGLKLIKAGKIRLYEDHVAENSTKKRKVPDYAAYCESVWGVKTRGYVASAKRMDKPKWDLVMAAGVSRMDVSAADDGDADDLVDAATDPRAFLEICTIWISSLSRTLISSSLFTISTSPVSGTEFGLLAAKRKLPTITTRIEHIKHRA